MNKKGEFLKVIDSAPVYQIIPPELFSKSYRDYFIRRNRQVPRSNIGRNELIDLTEKSVLDIGCDIGFFGWSNTKNIKSYVGIDSDLTAINAAQAITEKLKCKNLIFIHVDMVDFVRSASVYFDTCLFFSVYHHLWHQVGIEKSRKTLGKISKLCSELYFDMGQKNEPTNKARDKWHSLLPDKDPETFIKKEVLTNTLFKHAKILGETRVGNSKRLLFRFTR